MDSERKEWDDELVQLLLLLCSHHGDERIQLFIALVELVFYDHFPIHLTGGPQSTSR